MGRKTTGLLIPREQNPLAPPHEAARGFHFDCPIGHCSEPPEEAAPAEFLGRLLLRRFTYFLQHDPIDKSLVKGIICMQLHKGFEMPLAVVLTMQNP